MSNITCLALLVADRVWIENNGKFGMVGIFDNFAIEKFPTQVSPFFLYVRLGNVPKGKSSIHFNIVFDSSNLLISNIKAEVDVQLDNSIVQLPVPLPPLSLPSPGSYSINLLVNNTLITSYKLNANLHVKPVGK
jgi:hypothetical protein